MIDAIIVAERSDRAEYTGLTMLERSWNGLLMRRHDYTKHDGGFRHMQRRLVPLVAFAPGYPPSGRLTPPARVVRQ